MLNHRPIATHNRLRALLILTFSLVIVGSSTAFLVVDCRTQTGKSANQTLCNGIIAGAGDNHITVDKDQTVTGPFFGDGVVIGNGGNDVIINNGTTIKIDETTGRNGDIEGDVAGGNGGDDVMVNNGTVASDMDGDTVLGDGGSDVLINNGSVGDDMDGDNARKNGGSDLIINNGTVGGDIQADDNEDVAGSIGGDDIIVINGTIEGYIDADAGVKTGGDDLVILQNGANGGSDHELYLNGNAGDDTLVFNFTVPDQATFDDLSKEIAAAKSSLGSLTLNGQIFDWEHFEHLDNEIVIQGAAGESIITTHRGTQAALDPGGAALYCLAGNLTAVGMDSDKHAEWLFTVNENNLQVSFTQANLNGENVTLKAADGQTLSALASGELQLKDDRGRYTLTAPGALCTG